MAFCDKNKLKNAYKTSGTTYILQPQMDASVLSHHETAGITAAHAANEVGGIVEAEGSDAILSAFEDFLVKNMKASDIMRDEEGVLLFNVNQAAYLVEKSETLDEQRQTRKRINKALQSLPYIIKCASPGNKGLYSAVSHFILEFLPLNSVLADVPFASIVVVMHTVHYCLKGPKADEIRSACNISLPNMLKPTPEKEMVEYLVAWAQCNFIPSFTSHNKRAFQDCSFRPDVVWDLASLIVILECDQDAHREYNKQQESDRMQELLYRAHNRHVSGQSSSLADVVFI